MAVNDNNLEIINRIFGGDAGAQTAYFRELFEVLILDREGISPNSAQQLEIDRRLDEAKQLNRDVCNHLNVTPLEDIE